MRALIVRVVRDEGGASPIGYAVIAAAFALAGVIGGAIIGDAVIDMYRQFGDDVGTTLSIAASEGLDT